MRRNIRRRKGDNAELRGGRAKPTFTPLAETTVDAK
jgi:hypothetical protein